MLKKTLTAVFILTLLAPMAAWLTGGAAPDLQRGGTPVEFPSPYGGALLKTDYYRALDLYINERFVFRERLRRIKNRVDYKLFGRTDRDDIHVGRQGWLFRRVDVENHIRGSCDGVEDARRRILQLHAVEKLVTASGRRFRFLVVPSKTSIYPEYMGWVPLSPGGRCNAYDLLREAHRAHPLQSWVPLESAILARKFRSRLLYDPISSFWNARGAAVAAEALHQSLFNVNTLSPVMTAADRYDDLERQLLGFSVSIPLDTVRHMAGGRDEGLGHGLVYGDAAIESLLPHLSQMARRLEIISAETVPSRQIGENWRFFDSILIQTTESGIQDLQIDLDRIYDQLSEEARPAAHAPVDLTALRPVVRTALNPVSGGMEVKSLGDRSIFALVDLPGSYQRCFRVLKLNLSALQPDVMTVEYRLNPPLRVARSIHPGRFNLYLPLPEKSRMTLHFQPGGQAGLLVVHDAEIIGFPKGAADACGRFPEDHQTQVAALDTDLPPVATEAAAFDVLRETETAPVADKQEMAPRPGNGPNRPSGSDSGGGGREAKVPAENMPKSEAAPAPQAVTRDPGGKAVRTDDVRDDKGPPAVAVPSTEASTAANNQEALPRTGEGASVATEPDESAGRSSSALTTIELSDFDDGRIFQRQDHAADIIVSGVYNGTLTAIEARVVRFGGGDEVVPWTTIDAAPRNGIFLGLLPRVPEGGWYTLEARAKGKPHVGSQGQNRWGIGILIACIGQSNMKEWFHTGSDLEAHPLLRMYNGNGWQVLGQHGNGAIACGNRIIARTGVPVGLVEYAVNGSGLHRKADWGTGYWEDTRSGTIYRHFVRDVAATGGRLEFIIWIQGEADAARGTVTGEEYQTALTRFINRQVRLDITNGSHRPYLPFLVVAMMKRPGGKDEPHQALREAQLAVADQVAECYLAATTLDLKNQGKQHLAPEAYTTMGRRVAQTVLHVLELEDFHRGPRVVTVLPAGERTLDVALQHRGGDDITPDFGITGWEVVDRQGPATIQKVIRHDSRTLRIFMARPLAGPAEVRYLYGAQPDARRPLMDNAIPSLPLEAFRGRIDAPAVRPLHPSSGQSAN